VGKAWSAVSLRTDVLELAKLTQLASPARAYAIYRVVALGGGVMIQAGGAIVGGLGVSGVPTGEADEACARAGVAAVRDELEF
jgi:uncharacterized protein GlcG (DUF336 family)